MLTIFRSQGVHFANKRVAFYLSHPERGLDFDVLMDDKSCLSKSSKIISSSSGLEGLDAKGDRKVGSLLVFNFPTKSFESSISITESTFVTFVFKRFVIEASNLLPSALRLPSRFNEGDTSITPFRSFVVMVNSFIFFSPSTVDWLTGKEQSTLRGSAGDERDLRPFFCRRVIEARFFFRGMIDVLTILGPQEKEVFLTTSRRKGANGGTKGFLERVLF